LVLDILKRIKASKRGARLLLRHILRGSNVKPKKNQSSLRDSFGRNNNNNNNSKTSKQTNKSNNNNNNNRPQQQQKQNQKQKRRFPKMKPTRISRKFLPLIFILRRLIRNFKKCKFKSLLNRYCPIPETISGKKSKKVNEKKKNEQERQQSNNENNNINSKEEIENPEKQMENNNNHNDSSEKQEKQNSPSTEAEEDHDLSAKLEKKLTPLVRAHTPVEKVIGFMRAILKRIIPKKLFGSDLNFRLFLKNVSTFLRLRQYEGLSIGQIARAQKLSHIHWINRKSFPKTSVK